MQCNLVESLHFENPIFSSKDRVTCCEFFCEIISRHSSWLGQAGEQFTSILISSYDGETDPRVLINNFGLVSLVQTKGLPGKSKAGFLIDALNPRSFWISSAHLVGRDNCRGSINLKTFISYYGTKCLIYALVIFPLTLNQMRRTKLRGQI